MKQLGLLVFIIISFSTINYAQPSGFSLVKNTQEITQTLSKLNANIQSLQSDFVQIADKKALSQKVQSKGKFYFQQTNQIAIDYFKPYKYKIIISQNKLTMIDNGKKTSLNTKAYASMQLANKLIADCLTGNVIENKSFSSKIMSSQHQYYIMLSPSDAQLKSIFKTIEVFFNKNNGNVEQLIMNEPSGESVIMKFSNTKKNENIPKSVFTQ